MTIPHQEITYEVKNSFERSHELNEDNDSKIYSLTNHSSCKGFRSTNNSSHKGFLRQKTALSTESNWNNKNNRKYTKG